MLDDIRNHDLRRAVDGLAGTEPQPVLLLALAAIACEVLAPA